MKIRSKYFIYLFIGTFILAMISFSYSAKAQATKDNEPEKFNLKSHLYFGGGFGLQFGYMTLIEVSPLIGYNITPKFSVGLSPSYKYYKYNDYYGQNLDLKTNVWGGSIFTRYFIFQSVFAHAEFESLLYNTKSPGYPETKQQYNSFFVGGGYNQRIGGNSGMYILVLWNLNDSYNSPYSNPIIRVGFSVGL